MNGGAPQPPQTPPSPPDVGAVLRQARLRRGQTLEAIFQNTRIPKKFLEALEANRFDEFPAPVYLRGFLKGYCDHLDVDFEPLWNQISPVKPKPEAKPEAAPPALGKTPAPAGGPPAARAKPEPAGTGADRVSDARPLVAAEPVEGPPWGFLLILAAAVGFGGLLFLKRSPETAPRPAPTRPPPPVIAPLKPPEKMILKIIFRREAWVRLRCDGRLRFEGRGPAGFMQEWPAAGEFELRTETPENLSLSLDGKDVQLTPAMRDSRGEYKIARQ